MFTGRVDTCLTFKLKTLRASILQKSLEAEMWIQLVARLELLSLSQMPCTRTLVDNMDFFLALFYFISFCMNGK